MTITTILLILAAAAIGYAVYSLTSAKTPPYMLAGQEEGASDTDAEPNPDEPPTAESQQEPPAQPQAPPAETVQPPAEQQEPSANTGIEAARITEFRNPETGETAANPSNYRFAKKWIKQAMVDEGLLDKIYKNKELKGATEKKVKDALNQFKTLEKYHG